MRVDRHTKVLLTIIAATLLWLAFVETRRQVQSQPATTRVLRADRFELVDRQHRVRATLGFSEGEPELQLLDSKGEPHLSMRCVDLGKSGFADIAMYDNRGRVRALLDMRQITLYGADGHSGLLLGAGREGSSGIGLFDKEMNRRAAFSLLADGSPALVLEDGQGRKRAELSVPGNANPGLKLFDSQGTTFWQSK